MTPAEICGVTDAIRGQIGRVIFGQEDIIEHVLITLLARGHVLLEGPPGLGKTLLVRTLGKILGCTERRIAFTPDLMPSDVTGGNMFNQQRNAFEFTPGPVFTQLLLADEINRAPAKTQSALLEAMQERSVTIDGHTRALPAPFFVMATQNPVESLGTYPLPEAQLDRFLMKLTLEHPSREVEKAIVLNHAAGFDAADLQAAPLEQVTTPEQVVTMQRALTRITVTDAIADYITHIVAHTRSHPSLVLGASPRASVALMAAARARAALDGREFVTPDDVKLIAPSVLRHRLLLHSDTEFSGITTDAVVQGILDEVPVPKTTKVAG